MEYGRSYGQKHAATWRKLKRKRPSISAELANEVELEGINEHEVKEPLQSHSKSLTNNKLRELAEQHIQSEFTASGTEEKTPVREISAEFLSKSTTTIMQTMDWFIDNGPNNDWNCKAKQEEVFLK
jgi:hypothetical protein